MRMFKAILAKYKPFEKIFFRAEKSEDKAKYIKLKYQFRMMLTVSFFLFLMGIWLMIHGNPFPPTPIPLLVSVLLGFRFKFYKLPRTMSLIALTIIPLRYMSNEMMFAVPATILFMNVQILAQTQSAMLMLIHLTIQTSALYFYGIERIIKIIHSMTPEEIARVARANFYYCILGVWINLIIMQRFYAHVSNLLRKIGALWDNISKVNSQLNDQNVKLQSHLEMKDVFIYTFSHELKNALNGLLGNLYLAYDVAKDPQLIQFLSSAKVCGEVLKNFVHNILDSGKLENGNLEVAPERRDVMSFMEDVWAICGRIIENKRLQGYLEIAKNVPRYLDLDEQRMIQIILNLVSNACKFTEKGHVRIQVSWQKISIAGMQNESREGRASFAENNNAGEVLNQEEGGESNFYDNMKEFRDTSENCLLDREKLHLVTEQPKRFITHPSFYQLSFEKWQWNCEEVLSSDPIKEANGILKVQVLDTGCGMSEEDQTLLFRKFSQTNRIAGQRKVGTGLGLWICRELSKRLDGDIKARSKEGIGAVFELTIRTTVPIFEDKPRMFASTSIDNDSPSRIFRRQRQPNKKKILLADDDSFNIELMKNYLNKFGINYICAHDGEEAVSLFKLHHAEICYIITDNFMPKKTGTEAALEITRFLNEMRKPKIPIMCISGDVKVHVGEAGITSVIQKPINFDRLKEELSIIYPQIDGASP